MMQMERDAVDLALNGVEGLPTRMERCDGEPSTLSSTFILDGIDEVVLSVDSSGLSWRPLDSLHDDELSCLCGKTGADVQFSDIYAVELNIGGLMMHHPSPPPRAWQCFRCQNSKMYRFTVHGVERSKSNPSLLTLAAYTFGNDDVRTCEVFTNRINGYLSKELLRPKNLLVLVHPLSGKRNGRRTWELVSPIFSRAKAKTEVIVTERAGHAFDVMTAMTNTELKSYDGVVAVGGDGFFNEILNGLLLSRFKAPYPPVPPGFADSLGNGTTNLNCNLESTPGNSFVCEDASPDSPLLPTSRHQTGFPHLRTIASGSSTDGDQDTDFHLPNKQFRFGIIPAGSTDAIVNCTTGVRDPTTSALHIVLGKAVTLDIAQVVKWKATSSSDYEPSVRYTASFVGYGFYGDVITESEKFRWMGPKRYDFAGTKVFLGHRSYEAEISYLAKKPQREIPDPEDHVDGRVQENSERVICRSNCQICCTSSVCINPGEQPATLQAYYGDSGWLKSRGKFLSVGAAIISCRNERAPDGLVAGAHLSDGFLHLVLIKECPHALYLWIPGSVQRQAGNVSQPAHKGLWRHLIELTRKGGNPLAFRFVEHHKSPVFAFTSFGEESVWNLDGEILQAHKLSAQVFRGLVNLFATGPEV